MGVIQAVVGGVSGGGCEWRRLNIVIGLQNKKGHIEQRHRAARGCARSNQHLLGIEGLSVKQSIEEENGGEVDGGQTSECLHALVRSFNPSIWLSIFRVCKNHSFSSSALFQTLGDQR